MLNKNNIRELAYLIYIDDIKPIVGSDNCEAAIIGAWEVMVRKNTFKKGDLAIYFEIDSQVDDTKPEFEFMSRYHGKVKTQKYTFGGKNPGFYSQGLVMAPTDFGWTVGELADGTKFVSDSNEIEHWVEDESRFLTSVLGVTYSTKEDRFRKGGFGDKYKAMCQRYPKVFSNKIIRKIYKTKIGKRILFIFFGRKKKKEWPAWVEKTDEERIENLPYLFNDKETLWIPTEKIDGTSSTYTIKKGIFRKKYYFCSRNVVFDSPEKDERCFYEDNVYRKIGERYKMKEVLIKLLKKYPKAKWITIQGEIYGDRIQKRNYSLSDGNVDFAAFNLIIDKLGRFNPIDMTNELMELDIPCVPIADVDYVLPDNIEELREYVEEAVSFIDFKEREGLVFRSQDGARSFKCVSPAYLVKYHS